LETLKNAGLGHLIKSRLKIKDADSKKT